MLTAAVMPLCCCIVSTASGASCCAPVPVVEVERSSCEHACCESESVEESTDSSHCAEAGCSCCLKALSIGSDWSPPVDTIGTPMPSFTLVDMCDPSSDVRSERCLHDTDPPPKPCDPDRLRGHVILQV
ncbi:MAG: hypothetical protein CMJ24_06585 [Phycisphaerae bacterium]|jgi:hypothetical protein|nr:hypothetical protein [Phycisphaerae bacterium]|tara:strand:+ start:3615 stop:4001 length:387 start_codon:yes stop_codon:yes gene_type:complete